MQEKEKGRRGFLKGALVAGAGAAAGTVALVAPGESAAQTTGLKQGSAAAPSPAMSAAENMGSAGGHPVTADGAHVADAGSDFIVDVLRKG